MSPQIADEQVLKEIEEEGRKWGKACVNSLMTPQDLQWWATEYRPLHDYIRKIEDVERCFIADFDPRDVHPLANVLFAPAWGTHGACWVSPVTNPGGRVPDFRFVAFERGLIRQIRTAWKKTGGRQEH